jgi:ribosomal protein S12 methylthiotransferase accessory factor
MREANLIFEEYKEALFAIFTEDGVQKALRILKGDDFLIDVTFCQDYHNILTMFDRLMPRKY